MEDRSGSTIQESENQEVRKDYKNLEVVSLGFVTPSQKPQPFHFSTHTAAESAASSESCSSEIRVIGGRLLT